ncbi:11922_t:CDS:2, partial [Ambispora gerdemannii]
YELIKEVGNGSFGVVLQAQHKSTGQLVAVKKMKKKISSWEKACELREFKSNKNNTAKIDNKDDDDNIEYIVKIGDFGLAREIKSRPPYTDYVSTRWYRAPEVLLRSTSYSAPIDLWAIGAIMAELYTLKPLFPGQSEIDQMFKICALLGNPSSTCIDDVSGQIDTVGGGEWKEGLKLAKSVGFVFPSTPPQPLSKRFPLTTSESLLQMINNLLRYNPRNRLTALDALKHPYFAEANLVVDSLCLEEKSMITATKVIEKKRKNDFSALRKLAQGVTPVPYDKKNTRYSWSKAEELQKQEKIEQQIEPITIDRTKSNNKNWITLPPLNIDAANDIRQNEFVLPTIKAVSPFGSEQQPIIGGNNRFTSSADGIAHEQRPRDGKLSLSVNDDDLGCFHASRSAPPLSRMYLPETLLPIKNFTSEIEHLIDMINNPNRTTNTNVAVMPTQKFELKMGHKRSRSNTTGDIDQMVKEIDEINNNGVVSESSNSNQLSLNTTKTVDLKSYQLPDDVMNFFGPSDDSREIIRKSSWSSKDFMKVHRRYSSTSATSSVVQEESFYSLDLPYQDKSKSSSSSSTTTPYATRYYGQHMKTWHQMCQDENSRVTAFDANLGIVNDDISYETTPTILEHHQSESSPNSMSNTTYGFFSNLKAAVRSHAYSPTKHHNLQNINNSDMEEPLSRSSAPHLLPPTLPFPIRRPTLIPDEADNNSHEIFNENEMKPEDLKTTPPLAYSIETNSFVTKESSNKVDPQPLKGKLSIPESLNSAQNSFFSPDSSITKKNHDQPLLPPIVVMTSDDSSHKHSNNGSNKLKTKRSFILGNSNGEKKEWKLNSAPGLFSGWGTKISGNKGTGGDGYPNHVKKD